MDMELYAELTDSIEYALDEADFAAKESKGYRTKSVAILVPKIGK